MRKIWIIIPIILIAGVVWSFLGMPGWPKPEAGVIMITAFPESVKVKESFVITWQVNNPEPITIPHTAIHYGPESKTDISYPNLTPEFSQGNFSIPNVFTVVITAPETPGKLYFRAHAVIEDEDVWVEEQIIDIRSASPKPVSELEITPREAIEEPGGPQEFKEPEISVQESLPSPASQPTIQKFDLEQSVYPGYFTPDPLIVKKDIPLELSVTTKQREHINRISILPWISSSDLLIPGKVVIIEFIPDQTGEFKIRNIGHGFEGILKVVE